MIRVIALNRTRLTCFAAVLLLTSPSIAFSSGFIRVVAVRGETVPGGNGSYLFLGSPAINDSGDIAFKSFLSGTVGGPDDNEAVFCSKGSTLVQVARRGQPISGSEFEFDSFRDPALNDSGQTAFYSSLASFRSFVVDGMFRGNDSSVTQIARWQQATPNGDGTYIFLYGPAFNNVGQVAFSAALTGSNGSGIFRGSGGANTQIARENQLAPDGNGTLEAFSEPALNNLGQVAFRAFLSGTSGGSNDDFAIYRGNSPSLTQIARAGQLVPGGDGRFDLFSEPGLNDAGQAVFRANLTGTSDGNPDAGGIYLGNGTRITEIVRTGQSVPNGNGVFGEFNIFADPSLNDAGQVAFVVGLEGTSGGTSDDNGIFRADGLTMKEIVREGQPTPGGDASFSFFSNPALNSLGQLAFYSEVTGIAKSPDTNGKTIFFYDDHQGLVQAVRTGDVLMGSTISNLQFQSGSGKAGDERSGLNDSGQVAFWFALTDGRAGIGVWQIPEPSTCTVAIIAIMVLWHCGRGAAMSNQD